MKENSQATISVVSIMVYLLSLTFYSLGRSYCGQDLYNWFQNGIGIYQIAYPLMQITFGVPALMWAYWICHSNGQGLLLSSRTYLILLPIFWTIPMFLGYGLATDFKVAMSSQDFWVSCAYAAFFEELFYRAIFFGLLFRFSRLGFIPALALSALVFATMHLYQGKDLVDTIGIFFVTLIAAGFFAWLYIEWDYNLWLIIILHFMMNLSWELFAVAENALGGVMANSMRATTIALAIVSTVVYKKKKRKRYGITLATLLWKKASI